MASRASTGTAGLSAAELRTLEAHVATSGLEPRLLALVRAAVAGRVGCGPCLDRFRSEARAAGESEARLAALPAWRETRLFAERERAALLWTEAVAVLWPDDVSDAVFGAARARFSTEELLALTVAVIAVLGRAHLACAAPARAGRSGRGRRARVPGVR